MPTNRKAMKNRKLSNTPSYSILQNILPHMFLLTVIHANWQLPTLQLYFPNNSVDLLIGDQRSTFMPVVIGLLNV